MVFNLLRKLWYNLKLGRISAYEYLLVPGNRFYLFVYLRLIFVIFLVILFIWIPMMLDIDEIIQRGTIVTYIFEVDKFHPLKDYFFSGRNTPNDSLANINEDDLDEQIIDYQLDQFHVDDEYDDLEESWETSLPDDVIEPGEEYPFLGSDVDEELPPLIIHAEDFDLEMGEDEPLISRYDEIFRDEHLWRFNMLSSIDRVYRSGFFDYGYEYVDDRLNTTVPEYEEYKVRGTLEGIYDEYWGTGRSYSIINTSDDFKIEDESALYDDIITVDLDRKDEDDKKMMEEEDFPLGLENVELNFINYANNYMDELYLYEKLPLEDEFYDDEWCDYEDEGEYYDPLDEGYPGDGLSQKYEYGYDERLGGLYDNIFDDIDSDSPDS